MNHSSPCKKYFDGIISRDLESTYLLLHPYAPQKKVNEILFFLVNTAVMLRFLRKAKNYETQTAKKTFNFLLI